MSTNIKYTKVMMALAVMVSTMLPVTHAFWRMPCMVRSGYGRLDPLVSPGKMAAHAHAIHGSSGFSASADYNDLIAGDCTSCAVKEDKSAYWIPSLYFESSAGDFTLVDQVGGLLAYYFLNQSPSGGGITAFPAGFQMMAGDTDQRNFTLPVPDPPKSEWAFDAGQLTQAGLTAKAIGFNCLNYAAAAEGTLYRHFLPDQAYLEANCLDGLRLELMFPSCWNGKDLTSANFRDHVAYPDLVINGDCPTGFETRLPGLMYEVIWDTYAFKGQSGRFVLSNGDPTGYGYHGDFMMGWDETVLQNAVDQCTNLSGLIADCPVFTVKSNYYETCNFTEPTGSGMADYAVEDVYGPMTTLPGNCPINAGPAYVAATTKATGAVTASVETATQAVPTLSYSPGNTASVSGSYLPGDVFVVQTVTSSVPVATGVVSTSAPATTSAPDQTGPKPYTTLYSTNTGEIVEMVLYEETVTVSDYTTTTVTSPVGSASASFSLGSRKRHIHQHGRRAHNKI